MNSNDFNFRNGVFQNQQNSHCDFIVFLECWDHLFRDRQVNNIKAVLKIKTRSILIMILKSILLALVIINTVSIVDRTYYKYLGLEITATKQQIQSAFQTKKSKIATTETPQQQQRKLPLLQVAYDTLFNQKSRDLYDRYGKDYKKHGIKEITSTNPYSGSDSRKGPTMHIHLPVSVEELYNGTTIKAKFETKEACSKCQGTGADSLKSLKQCPSCKGKGFSMVQGRNMYGQPQQFEGICPQCQGSGKLISKRCPVCNGQKLVDTLKQIQVKIPAKYSSNELKLKNVGPQQQLGAPSDFLVHIQEIASKQWRRQGNNLIHTMKISLEESIFGFSRVIRHLSGEDINIERKQLTSKSSRVQIDNKGWVQSAKLIVQFAIQMQEYTDRQLDMWEQFFAKHKL